MKVKPLLNYRFANYPKSTSLNKNKVYDGVIAINQPKYKERGLIFINDMLLDKNEYGVVE